MRDALDDIRENDFSIALLILAMAAVLAYFVLLNPPGESVASDPVLYETSTPNIDPRL
ncbi:MAG: hypothetical protein IT363_05410 [Methanoregulaceae archaeon]|jgi:hypothetical protein|nr:hypothetical protein [Methanoregulaceae archaeon]